MSKKVLILGTLHGQNDAIEILKKKGWKVYACGFKREGPGVQTADEFFLVDILDVDRVAELASKLSVDCVYSVGSDIAMPTVVRVSNRLNLPTFHTFEQIELLHNKNLFRAFMQQNNIQDIHHMIVSKVEDVKSIDFFPAILKPCDSQGQRGIFKVDNEAEARSKLEDSLKYSRSGKVIIEEWLEGEEISIHVIIVNKEIKLYIPSDRFVWEGDSVGIAKGHGFPAFFLEKSGYKEEVRDLVEKTVIALGVETGPLYFQLKLTPRGPKIIEVAPRLDGCHLWRIIEQRTGQNIIDFLFNLLLEDGDESPEFIEHEAINNLFFHFIEPGQTFHKADFSLELKGRKVFEEFQISEGDTPRQLGVNISRAGYFIEEIS